MFLPQNKTHEVTSTYKKGKTSLHLPWENLQPSHSGLLWKMLLVRHHNRSAGHQSTSCQISPALVNLMVKYSSPQFIAWGGLVFYRVSHYTFISALMFHQVSVLAALRCQKICVFLEAGSTAKDLFSSTMSHLMHTLIHTHLVLKTRRPQAQKIFRRLDQLWSDITIFTQWFFFLLIPHDKFLSALNREIRITFKLHHF